MIRSNFFQRRALLIAIAVCLGLGSAVAMVEVAFRAFPRLIPDMYRQTLPVGGAELVTPGLLGRTPIDGVPLPYGFDHQRDMTGGVPHDLEMMGLVAPQDNPDVERYSALRYRLDRFGFLNPREIDDPDVVLVGDSFVVATGVLEPPGLQSMLAGATGLEVFNLAVPAIGPIRERWLLEKVGLALDPDLVIWFFFGGNDLDDDALVERHRKEGIETYADLVGGRTTPRSLALGFLGASIRSVLTQPRRHDHLPGLRFTTDGGDERMWFHPAYLRRLVRSKKRIIESSGWHASSQALLAASAMLNARQIPLLVVFVPSKAQVYLPYVEENHRLIHEMATFDHPIAAEPGEFVRSALVRRGDLEMLLRELCDAHGIAYRSLTPHLDQLARDGIAGYLSADTHWNLVGQAAARPVLESWIEAHRRAPVPDS